MTGPGPARRSTARWPASRASRAPLESLAEAAARWGDDKRALAAWTRLARIDPGSEVAIVGLGEAQFQAGKRDDARRTWAKLRGRPGSASDGHQRLGQLLYDHDLVDDALAEARKAEAAAPTAASPHRLLAQIAEREHRLDDAVAEWRRILTLARDPSGEDAGLRREARMRLLALLARQGRGKLEAEVHRLADAARDRPDDVDTAMFLAEAQQRMGDAMGAIGTLRAIAARGSGAPPGRWKEAAVDAELALARLLKQTGQLDEAAARLVELARLSPDRARDAELQIADLALGRYDLGGALAAADAAEKGADAGQLARIGELRERAGDDTGAATTYRAAIARGGPPTAALALARLLEREGDAAGSSQRARGAGARGARRRRRVGRRPTRARCGGVPGPVARAGLRRPPGHGRRPGDGRATPRPGRRSGAGRSRRSPANRPATRLEEDCS